MQWTVNTIEELPSVVTEVVKILESEEKEAEAKVLALHGDLGAGKTTFMQEMARQLGVEEMVVSPTFVVMKGYQTESARYPNLIHIDAYRIEDVDEMRILHFAELLQQKNTIICIEWAERIVDILPAHTYHLNFDQHGDIRELTLKHGH